MILADIESREGSTRIEAAVTRGRMALVCAIAGHTMAGGFLVVNAIEEAIYSCHFPEWCKAPGIVYFSVLIGPWLVGTYHPHTTRGARPIRVSVHGVDHGVDVVARDSLPWPPSGSALTCVSTSDAHR